ncbi:zwei Ig domain protein zig-8-like isoform X1 [Phlebotomus argentipes]|uniref:zwei Ig domain protein zig-8-like isoform X1 n=1 Tax=Phlebotomus argentipes TaxID=94469 RepID=UPI0028935FC3|nr:zwei Ig domain protein zig-8-like isoform X1 [Phlebotomus argentipes]
MLRFTENMETTTSRTQGYILVTMLLCAIHKTATTDTFDTAEEKDVSLHQIDNFYDSVMEAATELSVPHHDRHGPYFDVSASKNVTALVGKTAQLNCRVHNLGNKTVSWIRHRDIHLLTTGRFTYTSDLRFQSVHNPQTEDWTLQIRYPQKRDSGVYECQVSTTPPIGHSMYLSIVEPITTIIGGPDLYVNKGSTVNLTCIVRHLPEPPPGMQWTHNNVEINYDSPRGGVSVITEKGEITTSYLLIQRAKSPDSGKYTCLPSNANPFTVTVHVLNGEYPAAMQQGGKLKVADPCTVLLLALLVINLAR